MPEIATYSAAIAIGFLVLTTLVILWFTFTHQEGGPHASPPTDQTDESETTE